MRVPEFAKKADVSPIVLGHLRTMQNLRFGRRSTGDLVFFFGLPFVLGVVLVGFRFKFRADAVNGFLNAFAILTGLLLNLLVLVFSLSATSADKVSLSSGEKARIQLRRKVLKEVFLNVCYCILIAIVVVSTALVDLSYMRSVTGATTGYASTFLLSALTFNFVLTLLMVMKRMYKLIADEFEQVSERRAA